MPEVRVTISGEAGEDCTEVVKMVHGWVEQAQNAGQHVSVYHSGHVAVEDGPDEMVDLAKD